MSKPLQQVFFVKKWHTLEPKLKTERIFTLKCNYNFQIKQTNYFRVYFAFFIAYIISMFQLIHSLIPKAIIYKLISVCNQLISQ